MLGYCQIMRPLSYTNTWNVIRIGILYSVNGSASISGTPYLALGLNAGATAAGIADATTSHFVGLRTEAASWVYNAGAPAYYAPGSGPKATKRVGSTTTQSAAYTSGPYCSAAVASIRSALILEITKGSPNFTIQPVYATNATGAQTDITPIMFQTAMEAADMTGAAAVLGTAPNYAADTSKTLAVDEADGDLDSFAVYWSRSAVTLELSEVRHRMLS